MDIQNRDKYSDFIVWASARFEIPDHLLNLHQFQSGDVFLRTPGIGPVCHYRDYEQAMLRPEKQPSRFMAFVRSL